MGGKTIKATNCLIIIGLFLALLFTFSCEPTVTHYDLGLYTSTMARHELAFENYWSFTRDSSAIESTPVYISVIPTAESPLPNKWEYTSPLVTEKIDFSSNYLVFASMGFRGVTGPKITVQNIWQEQTTIYIQALFDEAGPTYLALTSEPTAVVKVSKEKMAQAGQITFILVDQNGNTKATTTSEIPK